MKSVNFVSRPLRKLFYPLGLISLALLPLLFYINLETHLQKNDLHALEVSYPSKQNITEKDTIGSDAWTKQEFLTIQDFIRYVGCQRMVLTGDKEDCVKLAYLKIALKEMMQNKSTVTGIEIVLTRHTKYKSLVSLYDICKTEQAPRYLHYRDKFWILTSAAKDPPEKIGIHCETLMHCTGITMINQQTSFSICLSFIAEHFIFMCSFAIVLLSSLFRKFFLCPL
jgi:hypothetical protein